MEVDLDGADADEATRRRAQGIETALRHAATDPSMRAQMLVPEFINQFDHVLFSIGLKLQAENAETRTLVMKMLRERHPVLTEQIERALVEDPVLSVREPKAIEHVEPREPDPT